MTMIRLLRRITRHFEHLFFTLGLTFMVTPNLCHSGPGAREALLVAINNAPAREVVRAQLHDDSVVGENTDGGHPHLATDMGKNLVSIVELYLAHSVGKGLDYGTLALDDVVMLSYNLLASLN